MTVPAGLVVACSEMRAYIFEIALGPSSKLNIGVERRPNPVEQRRDIHCGRALLGQRSEG